MARGSKAKYSSKQKRMARHIEEGAEKSGKSAKTAARIAWATVNKETGGAGKAISNTEPSRKGGRNSHKGSSYDNRRTRSSSTTHHAARSH